ncbi:MAG: hypothetical protein GY699_14295 [Desulfobacteraceae bacterium]|nr:hypothetical protein [Desulfobacteraceae bacterium]
MAKSLRYHESSFPRAFKEFSESGFAQGVHKRLVKQHMGDRIIGHIGKDKISRAENINISLIMLLTDLVPSRL